MTPESQISDLECWKVFLGKYGIAVPEPTRSIWFRDPVGPESAMVSDALVINTPNSAGAVEVHFRIEDGKFLGIDID